MGNFQYSTCDDIAYIFALITSAVNEVLDARYAAQTFKAKSCKVLFSFNGPYHHVRLLFFECYVYSSFRSSPLIDFS